MRFPVGLQLVSLKLLKQYQKNTICRLCLFLMFLCFTLLCVDENVNRSNNVPIASLN